jgi:acyl-CoA reductase-like NAD-dependent aldehyde dehydrogenase
MMKHTSVEISAVITQKSSSHVQSLINDAVTKGATVTSGERMKSSVTPATIIEGLTPNMDFYTSESFGPLLGVVVFDHEEEALKLVNDCPFGLSAAIFTQNHLHALKMAKEMKVSAIHINGSTVHDEATLPHGGHGDSGWGRFGASWGLEEFLQTKTIILNA